MWNMWIFSCGQWRNRTHPVTYDWQAACWFWLGPWLCDWIQGDSYLLKTWILPHFPPLGFCQSLVLLCVIVSWWCLLGSLCSKVLCCHSYFSFICAFQLNAEYFHCNCSFLCLTGACCHAHFFDLWSVWSTLECLGPSLSAATWDTHQLRLRNSWCTNGCCDVFCLRGPRKFLGMLH